MRFRSYPKYNNAGVEWITQVPEGWELRRLKYNCFVNPSGKKSLSDPTIKVNFLPMEKVSEDGDYDLSSKTEYETVSSGYTYFEDRDVLLAKITPCFENGKGALVENLDHGFGFGTTEFHILRFKDNLNPKYLYFLTKSHLFRVIGEAFMEGAAGQKRVSTDFVKNFPMPTPSLNEQKQIVNFLDKKTSQIDKTIEKDTQLIELLKEKRTAMINHAVTKGLDPDAKMKDSGIEWIGEIPEGWEVEKLKFNSEINKNSLSENMDPDYEFFYLDISNVSKTGEILNMELLRFENAPSRARRIPTNQDTIISTVRTYLKAIAYLDNIPNNLIVSTGFSVLNPRENIYPKYLYYLIGSDIFVQVVVVKSKGIAYPAINSTDLANIPIFYPNIKEQQKIVNYLNKKTSQIDKTIQKIERKIELLEEYKKSLIHHVVTGKVDVREEVV